MKKQRILSWLIPISLSILLIAALITAIPLISKISSDDSYPLWYVRADSTEDLFGYEQHSYAAFSQEDTALFHAMMTRLLSSPHDPNLDTPFAPNTTVRSVSKNGSTLTINLSSEFWNMSDYEITLAKYCIAKTFYGLNSVSKIYLCVEGVPVSDKGVSIVTKTDFITDFDELSPVTTEVTMYTLSSTGNALIATSENFTWYPHDSLPELVLDSLMSDYANGAVPLGTRVVSVSQNDDTVFVEFSDEFGEYGGQRGKLAVYSIVNTLSTIPNVTYVQISLNGEFSSISGISISEPLVPDLSLVN